MSDRVFRVVSDGPMPDWWMIPITHDTLDVTSDQHQPDHEGWVEWLVTDGGWGQEQLDWTLDANQPDRWEVVPPSKRLRRRATFQVRWRADALAALRTRFGWPSRVEVGHVNWPMRSEPVPPSVDELQALLPWAAMETNDDGELVIYTGIRLRDPETGEPRPHWLEGMFDV